MRLSSVCIRGQLIRISQTVQVDPDRLFTAEQSAGYLWDVLSALTPERSGEVIAWDGQTITP